MKLFFKAALERGTVATSAKIALFVGSVLAMINYGDRILLYGDMHARDKKSKTLRDSDSS